MVNLIASVGISETVKNTLYTQFPILGLTFVGVPIGLFGTGLILASSIPSIIETIKRIKDGDNIKVELASSGLTIGTIVVILKLAGSVMTYII